MRVNMQRNIPVTHEGAPAAMLSVEQELRRAVMACLLWENEFYESGESIAKRIERLALQLEPWKVTYLACEAREQSHLRHVPLLLLSVAAQTGKGHKQIADVIARVIQRADELTEFLAIHAKRNGVAPAGMKKKISAQMKKGIARAFTKFDEYQLAKYDRENVVRLRDALFLSHAKPKDAEQAQLWERLIEGELKTPDTWEVALSGGADKKQTFERLIRERKLGYLALLRNLRNMVDAGCDLDLVRDAIIARKGAGHVLPFRYVAAARAAPQLEPAIDQALCEAISEMPPLTGNTGVLIDVSGSMDANLSARSDMKRIDAAAALGAIINGHIQLFTFSSRTIEVPPRRGMAGVDAITKSQPHQSTMLGDAMELLNKKAFDRIIVVTDEQSHQQVPRPSARHAYMINVGSYQNGVGYGEGWTHIDGWSENIIRYIQATETPAPNDR